MAELTALKATVYGRVQGVFFRAFVLQKAKPLGLTGYVRNLPEGTVEVEAEGDRKRLEELLANLKVGPPEARVSRVVSQWAEYSGKYHGFNNL